MTNLEWTYSKFFCSKKKNQKKQFKMSYGLQLQKWYFLPSHPQSTVLGI